MQGSGEALRCSFCHKSQGTVGKLISSPSDYPRAYICDECIAVCSQILSPTAAQPPEDTEQAEHPWIHHPLAAQFCAAVERWVVNESMGVDGSEDFRDMRSLAAEMAEMAGIAEG